MARASDPDFEKMTMEEAFARYRDPMQIQQRLKGLAAKYDTCSVCGAKPSAMRAGYFHDGTSAGLPRAMCEPCRAANQQRAQAAIPKGTKYTHQYTQWRGAKK